MFKIGDIVQYSVNTYYYGLIVDNYYDSSMKVNPYYFGVMWLNGADQSVKITHSNNLIKVSP
mgnify:CR=1 FL=1